MEKQIEKMFDIPSEECIRVSMTCESRNDVAVYNDECVFVFGTMFNVCFVKPASLDFCKIRNKCGPRPSRGREKNPSVSFHQILLNFFFFKFRFPPSYVETFCMLEILLIFI